MRISCIKFCDGGCPPPFSLLNHIPHLSFLPFLLLSPDIPTSSQLWEFTLRVIKKPKYQYMVSWENQKDGLFRFRDAQAFAALWGKHRNRPNMTYDKVARALRYYYRRDILNQVGGRLTYRFSKRLSKLYTDE